MSPFARLRCSSRGILVWMLLAAYVCAPLAAWAQPRSLAVSVPFCTTQAPASGATHAPRRIVLRFSGHAQVAASALAFALPAASAGGFAPAAKAGHPALLAPEPRRVSPIAWRPPPRAPPDLPARL